MSPMKRTHRRNDLIQAGRDIVIRQGFNAAGLNDILTTAGVPKGSFYYYFASKEDFGLAIIEDFALKYSERLQATLEDERFSPLTRLNNYFEMGIADMRACQCANGCLIGNLAQELSAQNELFRDRLNQILSDWEQQFAKCLQAAYEGGEITGDRNWTDLAKFTLSGWEGAILQAKVTKSVAPMQTFVQVLFAQVFNRSN